MQQPLLHTHNIFQTYTITIKNKRIIILGTFRHLFRQNIHWPKYVMLVPKKLMWQILQTQYGL